MTFVLDAALFPPRDREEQIRDAVWSSLVRVEIAHRPRATEISARCAFDDLGPATLCSVTANATLIERTSRLAGGDATPYVFLGLQAAGSSMVIQDDRQAVLQPGEMALYDTTRPYTLVNADGIDHHYVRVPRAELGLPERVLARLTAVRLDSGDPVTRLLSGHLTRLIRELRRAGQGMPAARHTGRATVELIRAALASRLELESAGPGSDRLDDTRYRIMEYIEQNLQDAELNAATIAAAHHISVRQLYVVLAGGGIGLGEWIRGRRLEQCRKELTRGDVRPATIASVAHRWGFADAAHFSRVFRTAYGLSPREWRQSQTPHAPARATGRPPR